MFKTQADIYVILLAGKVIKKDDIKVKLINGFTYANRNNTGYVRESWFFVGPDEWSIVEPKESFTKAEVKKLLDVCYSAGITAAQEKLEEE